MRHQVILVFLLMFAIAAVATAAQTRQRKRASNPPIKQQAPKGSGIRYSSFLHSSEKHKRLTCNACHKVPTDWTARRSFPDVADFPDHDACVGCHRQQFFTRQAFAGTGPAICTICHVRAAPREDARFAFGKPNASDQALKAKEERQFTIEFPHDKHQNVIAGLRFRNLSGQTNWPRNTARPARTGQFVRFTTTSFTTVEGQKPDYNNCSICHLTNKDSISAPPIGRADAFVPPAGTFKRQPVSHDACFDCHWKNRQPDGDDCAGCHKLSAAFVPLNTPRRISAKFSHEGGKGEHVMECTTCHINITRASTLRGLTPDVPINICATCHRESKKTTYPKAVTIESELEQFKQTGNCSYCHTSDVGRKKPPSSHEASVQ